MLPTLTIRGHTLSSPIIQGGMGVGISLESLASAVATEEGAGIISSALLHEITTKKHGIKFNAHDAIFEEISEAKFNAKGKGTIGTNIMVYAARDYESSVRGSVNAGANLIISGAGLPIALPKIVGKADIALVPIVSSLRALKIIYKKWMSKPNSYREIDAVILEGRRAGGHLGFKVDEITNESNKLENLFDPIKDFAQTHGDFSVIVAGGIYTHADILYWINRGADGVQMGTRFLATEESTANSAFKNAVIQCTKDDIIISHHKTNPPGSPSGMLFRIIKQSPMFQAGMNRKPLCNKGAVLQKDSDGKYSKCNAKEDSEKYFCICNGLLSAAGHAPKELPLWTVGTNAWRVDKILSVHELMNELKGL
ncbi:MAG: nitronate monooxygenase family protein [Patescibacteria group bacterium]|nr:nitronate monooxygenase family protein [Patescibacteria group bacterium]